MPDIFALRNDYTQYQDLKLGIRDLARKCPDDIPLDDVHKFSQRNTALESWWPTPETSFIKNQGFNKAQIPDIARWTKGTLVLSPKSYHLLSDLLQQSGELLPLLIGPEIYYIYNCHIFGKEDKEKTRFSYIDNQPFELLELAFTEETSKQLLFKSKSQNCITLYCNAQFKQLIQENKLNGLIFDEELLLNF